MVLIYNIDLAKPKSGAPDFITIIITIIMMMMRKIVLFTLVHK